MNHTQPGEVWSSRVLLDQGSDRVCPSFRGKAVRDRNVDELGMKVSHSGVEDDSAVMAQVATRRRRRGLLFPRLDGRDVFIRRDDRWNVIY